MWLCFALCSFLGVIYLKCVVPWAWGSPAPSFLFLLATFEGVSGYWSGRAIDRKGDAWRFPPSETFKPGAWSWIRCARAGFDVQTGTWKQLFSFLLQQLELDPSLLESPYIVFSPGDGSGG